MTEAPKDEDDEKVESDEKADSPEPPPADNPYRGRGPSGTAKKPKATIWQRATYRWTAITAVMAALLVLYTQHPYYQGGQFAPFRPLYTTFFVLWLAFGLFYVKATIEKFKEMRYVVRDGGLHLLLLARRAQFAFQGSNVLIAFVTALAGGGLWALSSSLAMPTLEEPGKIVLGFGVFGMFVVVPMRLAAHKDQTKRFFRLFKRSRIRTTGLAIIVKGFFTPLMTGFLSGHATAITDAWLRHKHLPALKLVIPKGNALIQAQAWFHQVGQRIPDLLPSGSDFSGLFAVGTWTKSDVSWGLDIAYNIVFFVDCGTALFGYASESRWIGNKTRSVEPTAFGWLVCLACYPPYNNVLGTYLPLENGSQHITNDTYLLALRALTVFLFSIYAAATVAFGFKFSNLTNRGIISRGPYRYIRHPAYLTKCSAWWLEHIPTMSITKAVFLTMLCGVYALRAWTEERHLSRDPDYVAYKKKVPWVVFPGIY